MNKKTIAVDSDTYQEIISTMKSGFEQSGVTFQPNVRIATVLILEYNLGLRVGDVLHLTMDSFVKDGDRYRLDIYEEKTGKYGNFTVPDEIYHFIRDYAYEHKISPSASRVLIFLCIVLDFVSCRKKCLTRWTFLRVEYQTLEMVWFCT